MTKRKIIKIDENKCNGCGKCIPNCPEGALQLIDKKARLVSDLFCDGLGACIGHCPEGAITIEEREAEPYNEDKVMENIVKQGKNTIKAHLKHLKDHGANEYFNQAVDFLKEKGIDNPLEENMKPKLPCGCPGTMLREIKKEPSKETTTEQESELTQWPLQLNLLPPQAPFFKNADLLIAADCVGFANPNLHSKLLKGKAVAIGCPKLDDIEAYKEKIKSIIELNDLKSITVAIMEVPCCYGLYQAVEEALKESGKDVPLSKVIISINGSLKEKSF
jgi:ferredoxin